MLVQGVGISEKGLYSKTITINGKSRATKEYALWSGLINRCYSEKSLEKNPTYRGCYVSENFKNFQWFAKWCNQQVGFGLENYHIDKDLLSPQTKMYSEHTCIFLPREINLLIQNTQTYKTNPVGVFFRNKDSKYVATVYHNGKHTYSDGFEIQEEAVQYYKIQKEKVIKEVAEKYKGKISTVAYNALMTFKVASPRVGCM